MTEGGQRSNGDEAGGSLLSAREVTKAFGGLVAVDDVSFDVPPRSIVSIIGPNGAGKTTLFNMLTGLYRPTAGSISFGGQDITRKRPDRITALGVARTFQNIRLFGTMSALENVLVGQHARTRGGLLGSILYFPVRREEREAREKGRELLAYVGLRPESSTPPPPRCPTATSAASRSRGRSAPIRGSSSSTSPRRE